MSDSSDMQAILGHLMPWNVFFQVFLATYKTDGVGIDLETILVKMNGSHFS